MKYTCPCLTDISHKKKLLVQVFQVWNHLLLTLLWLQGPSQTRNQGFVGFFQVSLHQQKGEVECWRNQVYGIFLKPFYQFFCNGILWCKILFVSVEMCRAVSVDSIALHIILFHHAETKHLVWVLSTTFYQARSTLEDSWANPK